MNLQKSAEKTRAAVFGNSAARVYVVSGLWDFSQPILLMISTTLV